MHSSLRRVAEEEEEEEKKAHIMCSKTNNIPRYVQSEFKIHYTRRFLRTAVVQVGTYTTGIIFHVGPAAREQLKFT